MFRVQQMYSQSSYMHLLKSIPRGLLALEAWTA